MSVCKDIHIEYGSDLYPVDINKICKLIDLKRNRIFELTALSTWFDNNKKRFSLVHAQFIGEYLNNAIKSKIESYG